ncbi:hypothetical protein [uncultured Gordonia sp.]|uniref:hypothetical protein n=1 Tax=uncultured Gordonia sp. TaxID=198437 RepID=UPI00258E43B9|nr:hypothetical protein [uncultured Gordonia sp.]
MSDIERRKVHEPGNCPDSYGNTRIDPCDGYATLGVDPYRHEMTGDETPVWQCQGVRTGSAQDI